MGHIQSTYSYKSQAHARLRMFEQLEYYDIPVYSYDNSYYVIEKPAIKTVLRLRIKTDFWGNLYYECFLEREIPPRDGKGG